MARYQQPRWSVELPEGWVAEREDESTLFRREQGVGTLSVTLLCDEGNVTREVLLELSASTREEGHSAVDIKVGSYAGLFFCYEEEDTTWREWYLAADNCLFFVSYDAPTGQEATEFEEIEQIVATLQLQP